LQRFHCGAVEKSLFAVRELDGDPIRLIGPSRIAGICCGYLRYLETLLYTNLDAIRAAHGGRVFIRGGKQ
jgi:hypothetical protein